MRVTHDGCAAGGPPKLPPKPPLLCTFHRLDSAAKQIDAINFFQNNLKSVPSSMPNYIAYISAMFIDEIRVLEASGHRSDELRRALLTPGTDGHARRTSNCRLTLPARLRAPRFQRATARGRAREPQGRVQLQRS